MHEITTYSSEYLRFISSFEVAPNNEIIYNTLDKEAEFISRYYTPRLKVSELATFVLRDIYSEKIRPVRQETKKGTLLDIVKSSGMKDKTDNIYQLCKLIGLEIFSMWYAIEHQKDYRKYFSQRDIRQVRNNILYVLDVIGDREDYLDLIELLHELDIHVGYIQGQVPVIKGEDS